MGLVCSLRQLQYEKNVSTLHTEGKILVASLFYMIPGAVRTKHAGTGWFKPIARSWLSIQCPRRFLKIEPEPWHTSFMSRCQAVDECFFFFFRQIFLFLFFLGHLGLRRAKISGDRKKKKNVNGWVGAHRTRVPKFQGLSPKKYIWTAVRKTCVIRVGTL